jgi:hypothetical protein
MKTVTKYKKALQALQKEGVPTYQRCDMEYFAISAEDAESYKFCSFYDGRNMPDWEFGVSPVITNILRKFGLHAEWINGGELGVYED